MLKIHPMPYPAPDTHTLLYALATLHAIQNHQEPQTRALLAAVQQHLEPKTAHTFIQKVYNALDWHSKHWLKNTIAAGMSQETYSEAAVRISKNMGEI